MGVATLPAIILTMSASVMADAIRITSSDHALTFAYNEMIWQQLYLDRAAGELAARITFKLLRT